MLKAGDKVAVVSMSACISEAKTLKGIAYLKSLGLEVVLGRNIYGQYRYMSATAEERVKELEEFYADKEIKAIICTRGGGGCLYLLPLLNYELIKNNPKPIFGLSDITAVQNAVYEKTGVKSYTGFLLTEGMFNDYEAGLGLKEFENIIKGNKIKIKNGTTVKGGKAEGILIGGNLGVFRYLFGTEYLPDLTDKILLLEDIGTKTWQLDLALEHLRLMPNFDKLKGIIFGQFTNCPIFDPEDGTIDEIIDYFCKDLNIPVIKDLRYGHSNTDYILPIGAKIKLDADTCTLEEV